MSRTSPDKQAYDERLSEEFSGRVHDYEKMPLGNEPAVTGITTQKRSKGLVLLPGLRGESQPEDSRRSPSKAKWATISVTHFDICFVDP
jgi:hypothetical protein